MIRAFLLQALGLKPVWEVRSVSLKSGKDIPGQCKFKGGYRAARAYFKDHPAPPDHELRLQALLVTKSRYFPKIEESEEYRQRIEGEFPDDNAVPGIDDLEVDEPDHECDAAGPLEWNEKVGGYVPTCSICGEA